MQLLKSCKVILITKTQDNCLANVISCTCIQAHVILDLVCQNQQAAFISACLGVSGGEMGEQLAEPQVLCLAKVQLFCRQRP